MSTNTLERPVQLASACEYKIEKSVPITGSRQRARKYPFPDMEIGDSFYVPAGSRPVEALRNSINASSRLCKPAVFTTRRHGNGVRVWRIA